MNNDLGNVKKVNTENHACHLCGRSDNAMHGRSHVIPAWIFRQIEKEGGSMLLKVDIAALRKEIQHGESQEPEPIDPTFDTPFDTEWYCVGCERLFSKHDDFSAKFLKDAPNLGKPRARIRRMPPRSGRPEMFVVSHMKAWMWRRFVLSIVYRMHMSNHLQYRSVQIGEENASRIREMLVNDTYHASLYDHDIVTAVAAREFGAESHAFVSPVFSNAEPNGGFKLFLGLWGIWLFVGYPKGSVPQAALVPEDTCEESHFALISERESMSWFGHVVGLRE